MRHWERDDVKALPLAVLGVAKGVVEEFVSPVIEPYKPHTLEEKVEAVALGVSLANVALAGYCIYKSLTENSVDESA